MNKTLRAVVVTKGCHCCGRRDKRATRRAVRRFLKDTE